MTELNRRQLLAAGAGAAVAGLLASTTTPTPKSVASAPPSTVPAGAVDDLRRRLQGNVLTPLDASYPGTGVAANTRYASTRPAVIAQCRDETDVVTCVRWANENGVAPVVRGGGHSYAGLSTTTGLMIDISALDVVTVDQATGIAHVAGAALNGDVLDKTIHTPFLLPGGTCLGVGTGGLVLGGGIGYNTHWAGLTCDHLMATRVVLASGEVAEADHADHADLYWACRGGMGGNFGINTAFTFQLVEAPQTVTYFRYDFRGADDAGAMLSAIHHVVQSAPAGLNASSAAQASPVGDDGPREAIDAFTRGQYVGPSDKLRDLLAPVLAAATPTKSAFQEMPFWDVQQQIWASGNPTPHSFGDWSRYAREPLPDDAVAEIIDLLAACPVRTASSNGSVWFLGWVGGAVVDRFSRTDTAYVARGMPMLLRPTPVWEADDPPSVGEDLLGWTEDVIGVIAPLTPDESYQNFPNRLLPNPLQQYFAENLERLIDVKTAYDPGNVFQNPQSIPTR